MSYHANPNGCTDDFQTMLAAMNYHLERRDTNSALRQIRTCFDDRMWEAATRARRGQVPDEAHRVVVSILNATIAVLEHHINQGSRVMLQLSPYPPTTFNVIVDGNYEKPVAVDKAFATQYGYIVPRAGKRRSKTRKVHKKKSRKSRRR